MVQAYIKESRFKVDIFNILGQDGVDDMNEYGESGGPTSYPYQYYQNQFLSNIQDLLG